MTMRRVVMTWEIVGAQTSRSELSRPGFEWFQVDRVSTFTASMLYDGGIVSDEEATSRLRAMASIDSYIHHNQAREPVVTVDDIDPAEIPSQEVEHMLMRSALSGPSARHRRPRRAPLGDETPEAVPQGGSAGSEPAGWRTRLLSWWRMDRA